ncbi:hypothetical protein GPECTOR_195g331 [Gonium pectorale]|uniref:Uncharacterized protein n=1 Tax=Gonium pectorale TaxID=33097 RepID=A0A150FX18_GONPE|nr:hypothetical protein GPECTOR_195g331 [Gonium pectorale]|eukprot:KXZ42151.1 hypothetical protein GPECTOR_195g331 [Gonium pectorale]
MADEPSKALSGYGALAVPETHAMNVTGTPDSTKLRGTTDRREHASSFANTPQPQAGFDFATSPDALVQLYFAVKAPTFTPDGKAVLARAADQGLLIPQEAEPEITFVKPETRDEVEPGPQRSYTYPEEANMFADTKMLQVSSVKEYLEGGRMWERNQAAMDEFRIVKAGSSGGPEPGDTVLVSKSTSCVELLVRNWSWTTFWQQVETHPNFDEEDKNTYVDLSFVLPVEAFKYVTLLSRLGSYDVLLQPYRLDLYSSPQAAAPFLEPTATVVVLSRSLPPICLAMCFGTLIPIPKGKWRLIQQAWCMTCDRCKVLNDLALLTYVCALDLMPGLNEVSWCDAAKNKYKIDIKFICRECASLSAQIRQANGGFLPLSRLVPKADYWALKVPQQ